jgi:hypothetical protein
MTLGNMRQLGAHNLVTLFGRRLPSLRVERCVEVSADTGATKLEGAAAEREPDRHSVVTCGLRLTVAFNIKKAGVLGTPALWKMRWRE